MTQTPQMFAGLRRAADALLSGYGGRAVKLRVPASAAGGDPAEELGLAVPQFQDVEISPASFRNAGATTSAGKAGTRDLIISATAIEALTSSQALGSAEALFASAFGVLVDDVLLAIVSSTELEAGGTTYAYRLTVREPVRNAP